MSEVTGFSLQYQQKKTMGGRKEIKKTHIRMFLEIQFTID